MKYDVVRIQLIADMTKQLIDTKNYSPMLENTDVVEDPHGMLIKTQGGYTDVPKNREGMIRYTGKRYRLLDLHAVIARDAAKFADAIIREAGLPKNSSL